MAHQVLVKQGMSAILATTEMVDIDSTVARPAAEMLVILLVHTLAQ